MNAKQFRTKLETTRQENDKQTYRLEMQGKRISLCKTGYKRTIEQEQKRGVVVEFSARARSRRLRRIAEVNWRLVGESSFITLTYPDEVSDHTMSERKTHRYLFNRWLCKTIGRPLGCFWRVEWLPRQSGNFIGQLRPHMHLLYLNTPKICWLRAMAKWMTIIGVKRFTQVNIKPLEIAEAVSVYVAKYTAKEASTLLLDDVPKRNRTGRHAGELRKSLIPTHDKKVVSDIEEYLVIKLKQRANELLWWYDVKWDDGFTLLGSDAEELIKELEENYLAKDTPTL